MAVAAVVSPMALLKNHWPGSVQTLSQQWMSKSLLIFMHTTISLIQQSWIIIVLLLSDLRACIQVLKIGSLMKPYFFQWLVWTASWDFKVVKKWWAGALLSVNAAVLCENHRERVTQFWTSLSEDRKTVVISGGHNRDNSIKRRKVNLRLQGFREHKVGIRKGNKIHWWMESRMVQSPNLTAYLNTHVDH